MRLISLNTWGCRVTESLYKYIQEQQSSTDIFSFQEILKGGNGKTIRDEIKSGFEDISKILTGYTGYFSRYGEGGYYNENSSSLDFEYGIACFVRTDLKQDFIDGITLCDLDRKWNDYSGGFAAGAAMAVKVEDFIIENVHGIWQGSIKTDTEAKIEQSRKILELANREVGKKIICGDLNLLPETESIKMLSSGRNNLIKEYAISSTRSSLYTKENRHADYVFTDKEVNVNSFLVQDIEISDHLPLMIEFK